MVRGDLRFPFGVVGWQLHCLHIRAPHFPTSLLVLPAVLSSSDWLRQRRPERARQRGCRAHLP